MKMFIILVLVINYSAYATICGEDNRQFSNDNPIGRLAKAGMHKGCTVTMISNSCGVTAGHCIPMHYAEFNTPKSKDGKGVASKARDQYLLDKKFLKYRYDRKTDWGVVRFSRNKKTGLYPGQAQGYYSMELNSLNIRPYIRITGYGRDTEADRNFSQQTHTGQVLTTEMRNGDGRFFYNADTMGGNSGSAVIDESSGKIIGIHTNGGCSTTTTWSEDQKNRGSIIATNIAFKLAIHSCLVSEQFRLEI